MSSLTSLAFQATTGLPLDELPLVSAGPRTKFLKNFGTWSATLDTNHPMCPADWAQTIDDTYSINVLVDEDDDIRWSGYPSGNVKKTDGTVDIEFTSVEGFAGKVLMPDYRKIGVDQSEIFSDFVDVLNAAGYGFIKRIVPTGTLAACIIKQSDNKPVLTAMQEQSSGAVSYEWRFGVEWTDETHTAIQKVAYMANTLGNTAEETTHVFELIPGEEGSGNEGNIVDYSEQTSTAAGSRATHVWATGDGSGAKQLRTPTPVVDTARIAAGYPEVHFVQNYPGVTRAVDILQAVQSLADNLFKGSKALTLKVRDSEHTPIKDVALGDHVFVDISTSNLPILKVMRVLSTSEDSDDQFDPLVADIGIDPMFIPRPDDPAALGRILDGIGKSTSVATSSYDPFAGGFSVPKASGSGTWDFDLANGFGARDADGNFTGVGGTGNGGGTGEVAPGYFYKDTGNTTMSQGVGTDHTGSPLPQYANWAQYTHFWNGSSLVGLLGCEIDPFMGRGDSFNIGSGTIAANAGNGRGRVIQLFESGDQFIGPINRQSTQDGSGQFRTTVEGEHIQLGRLTTGSTGGGPDPVDGDIKTLTLEINADRTQFQRDVYMGSQTFAAHLEVSDGLVVDRGFTSQPGSTFNVRGSGTFDGSVYASTFSAGTKSFVQVHPKDNTKKIRYMSTESPMNMIEDKGRVVIAESGRLVFMLRSEFDAIMIPDTLDVFLTQRGSRPEETPWYEEIPNGFIVHGDAGATISWLAKAERQSINDRGEDVIAFEVISENDLPDFLQPDYIAPDAV